MSLELAIQENTAAIHALIARLATGTVIPDDKPTAGGVNVSTAEPADFPNTCVQKEKTQTQKPETKKVNAQETGNKPEVGAASPGPVTYDEVKKHILELSKAKGREIASDALSRFGVTKGPDLLPEQFADFVEHAKELLGA